MQDESRRKNKDRSEAMRATLIAAARKLFVVQGYAATGTPEIVALAGVTRGALYHHFTDKEALFRAVVEAEALAVAANIRETDYTGRSAAEALILGGEVFLEAMTVPGRTRLLLLDAPAVLGRQAIDEIDATTGGLTLVEGLSGVMAKGEPVAEIAALLSAAYDRAALAIDLGRDADVWRRALARMIEGVVHQPKG
jgi:AcrR family transcriptional regulator